MWRLNVYMQEMGKSILVRARVRPTVLPPQHDLSVVIPTAALVVQIAISCHLDYSNSISSSLGPSVIYPLRCTREPSKRQVRVCHSSV